MEHTNFLNFYAFNADFLELVRLFEIKYFDLKYGNYDDITINNTVDYDMDIFSDVRNFDFIEEGIIDKIKEIFPFMTFKYSYMNYSHDYGNDNLYLGSLDKTMITNSDAIEISRPKIIIGDYISITNDSKVIKTDSGLFHEVKMLADCTLIGRGSNSCGQLDFTHIEHNVDHYVCGDNFTAVLSNNQVKVFGMLLPLAYQMPKELSVKLLPKIQLLPEDIETRFEINDPLEIVLKGRGHDIFVRNMKLGTMISNFKSKKELVDYVLKFTTPRIDYISDYVRYVAIKEKQVIDYNFYTNTKVILDSFNVEYKNHNDWQDIEDIKAIEGGLLARDKNNNYFFDGNVNNILTLKNFLKKEVN